MRNPLFDEQIGFSIISYFLICVFGFYLMGGERGSGLGLRPDGRGVADRCGFFIFESTIWRDTIALVVVRMGAERCFASLLWICSPVDRESKNFCVILKIPSPHDRRERAKPQLPPHYSNDKNGCEQVQTTLILNVTELQLWGSHPQQRSEATLSSHPHQQRPRRPSPNG